MYTCFLTIHKEHTILILKTIDPLDYDYEFINHKSIVT